MSDSNPNGNQDLMDQISLREFIHMEMEAMPESKKKDVLAGALVYLSGAMEAASDGGIAWRSEIIKKSHDLGLKIKYIDPTQRIEDKEVSVYKEIQLGRKLRQEGRWDDLNKFAKSLRRRDLRQCDLVDCLVAYIDPAVPTCGTFDEIFLAERQKKPRFLICRGGKEKVPTWLFGVFHHSCIFDNIDQCIERLVLINNGTIPTDDKWVLIRRYLYD